MILGVPVWCKTTERARKYVSSPLPWLGRRLQDRVTAYSQVGEMILALFPYQWQSTENMYGGSVAHSTMAHKKNFELCLPK